MAYLVAAGLAALAAVHDAPSKPDIVFIVADDLGFNEMGYRNSSRGLMTPFLDDLAFSGVQLENYYVQPICSPTRSALMTGRYPVHLGLQANVIFYDTPWGIDLKEKFIPQIAKEQGYATAAYGKWHLGMFKDDYMPTSRGFDEYEGYLQGCGSKWTHVGGCCDEGSPTHDQNYTCVGPKPSVSGAPDGEPIDPRYLGYDWWQDTTPHFKVNHTTSTELIKHAAEAYIGNAKADVPFFLYLPFQNVHGPVTVDSRYRAPYEEHTWLYEDEKTLYGYITELDEAVGHVVQAMKAAGRHENAVYFFTSDNGAPPGVEPVEANANRNWPLRGFKSEIWEGGTKVTGFVSSVDHIPAARRGTKLHEPMHVTDWLPTIAHVVGGSTEGCRPLDGYNMWDVIANGAKSPRTEMVYNVNPLPDGHAGPPKAGLRVGDLKVLTWGYRVKGIDGATATGPFNKKPHEQGDPMFEAGPALFNVTADPAEATNLARDPKFKAQLDALLAKLAAYAEGMVWPMSWEAPYQGPDYWCANCSRHPPSEGVDLPWGPWDYKP
eukprot:TRINITY_DN6249_c0_g1_i6.p1 TRINITY_DN6249_c0_g1~~TRINITY_DN6249_c0_g1_i6.p1  ORF type:complete len:547 (+),score=190.94 TRINITY_DN6249_c0_g1_i6:40-1680(+)